MTQNVIDGYLRADQSARTTFKLQIIILSLRAKKSAFYDNSKLYLNTV